MITLTIINLYQYWAIPITLTTSFVAFVYWTLTIEIRNWFDYARFAIIVTLIVKIELSFVQFKDLAGSDFTHSSLDWRIKAMVCN